MNVTNAHPLNLSDNKIQSGTLLFKTKDVKVRGEGRQRQTVSLPVRLDLSFRIIIASE